MKGIITWGSTYSKLNIDANLKVSDLNNSKVLIATNVGPILQISQKRTTWEVFYELSRQRMLDKKRCQPGQKTSTPPASWSSWSSWSFLTQNSDELTRHFCFFCVFFFPLSFWGGLEVSSNRNPASPKKCQFIEAEEVLSSALRMKAACGAALFF